MAQRRKPDDEVAEMSERQRQNARDASHGPAELVERKVMRLCRQCGDALHASVALRDDTLCRPCADRVKGNVSRVLREKARFWLGIQRPIRHQHLFHDQLYLIAAV